MDTVAENNKHSIVEDVQAIASATLIIALGVMVFKTAGLVTGGTTGLAFRSVVVCRLLAVLLVGMAKNRRGLHPQNLYLSGFAVSLVRVVAQLVGVCQN